MTSLALISRTVYEQNQAEIATLRKQIEDKEKEISSLIVKKNEVGVSTGVGAVGVAVEIGVLEVQITELQKCKEVLFGENKRISKELESCELKGKAIKAEITRLRLDGSKRSKELEERNLKLSAELLDARTAFSQLQQSIGSQSRMTNGHRIGSSGKMMADSEATLRSENEKLLTRLRSTESDKADLHRINQELRIVVEVNEDSNVALQKGNLKLQEQISSLESDHQNLQKKSAKFDMEEERLKNLVANLRTEIEKLRAIPPVNNETGAREAEMTKLRKELEHLNSQANTQLVNNIELRKENEGLAEENNKLERRFEAESMKLIARDAEIEILSQRSQRFLDDLNIHKDLNDCLKDENLALQSQKESLLADLGDMERDLRTYRAKLAEPKVLQAPLDKPFDHIPSRKDARRNSGIDSNGAHGKSHENSISPRGLGTKRPLDEMEDSGKEAAGDVDYSSIGGNGNGSSRNFSIRAIASGANGPPGVTNSSTRIGTSVPTSSTTGRNLIKPVRGLHSRSLFERISLPLKPPPISPVLRRYEDLEIERLVSSTKTGKRCIICRFDGGGNPPDPADLLSVVCGGPLESLRIMGDRNMGMLCFLRPHDAEEFLDYAERSLNGKRVFRDEHCVVDFLWQDKAIKPIEKEIAYHVVHYSRSRIFKFHCLPFETPLERCLAKITSLIGDRPLWLNEGHRVIHGREVEVEFMSIRDATEAKRLLDAQATAWGGISWCREECDRPIPTSRQ